MIQSKKDLYRYINCDAFVYGGKEHMLPYSTFPRLSFVIWLIVIFLKDLRCNYKPFNFQTALRMHEYYANKAQKGFFDRWLESYWRNRHRKLGFLLGFDIPINVFGPGLRINHWGLIVVNPNVRVGAFCDIHQGVNIGNQGSDTDVPVVGDNVWIGPGAKLFGKIEIASGCAIGANAVVNKSFLHSNVSIAGIPAKVVSEKGNANIRVYSVV